MSSIRDERVREERRLWEAIPTVPELQCAWQIYEPIALWTRPPRASKKCAQAQDQGIWTTAEALLNEVPGSEQELKDAAQVASLPMRIGGLGLRSAPRGVLDGRTAHDEATHTSSGQRGRRRVAAGGGRDRVSW